MERVGAQPVWVLFEMTIDRGRNCASDFGLQRKGWANNNSLISSGNICLGGNVLGCRGSFPGLFVGGFQVPLPDAEVVGHC